MARSEAPASAKAAGNSYPLCLPPPRQSSTLHECGRYPRRGADGLSIRTPRTWGGWGFVPARRGRGIGSGHVVGTLPPPEPVHLDHVATASHRYGQPGALLPPTPYNGFNVRGSMPWVNGQSWSASKPG